MTAPKPEDLTRARDIVGWYTLAASATGAVPVPASSAGVIANNAFMIAHIASLLGASVQWSSVTASFGIAGTLNIAGRTVFIEGAKALAWGTGSLWAAAGLSLLGASTAGLQTYIIGLIAIEIAKRGGHALSPAEAADAISTGKDTYKSFVTEMKSKDLADPGSPSNEKLTALEEEPPPNEIP